MNWKPSARILSILAATLLLPAQTGAAAGTDSLPNSSGVGEEYRASSSYSAYLADHEGADNPALEIAVELGKASGGEAAAVTVDGGTRTGWLTGEEETVTWPVTVPQSGFYQLKLTYYTGGEGGSSIERRLLVDGVQPYEEAGSLSLSRIWRDIPAEEAAGERRFSTDRQGNERLPGQETVPAWTEVFLRESSGMVADPLRIYLTAGEHTLSLVSVRESLIVGGLTLCQSPEPLSYAAYLEAHRDAPATGDTVDILQGEDYACKSHPEIVPITDRTSAATQPSSPSLVYLNTVGGTNWSVNGMWIEWDVTVPKDGLYRIALKVRQNFLSGMTANRRLLLDGELPFAEAGSLTFRYASGWKSTVRGDENGEFAFYLTAGTTHTLRLECALGESAPLLQHAQTAATSLNDAYRRLVMYMGSSPDANRDYKVDQVLPEVVAVLEENRDSLQTLSEELIAFSGGRGDANVAIDNLVDVLRRMLRDTRDIPSLLSTFRDNIAALSTWIQTQSRQSLEIDYLAVLGGEAAAPKAAASFFQGLVFGVQSFLASFSQDYSLMLGDETEETIEVWVSTGRDQTQVLKNLIANEFTPGTGIGVNLKLVSGQLLLATVAGDGPDVALNQTSADVMNFALRSAVESLEGYEGFGAAAAEFAASSLTPLTWDGRTYGLPETQNFPLLFYRSDILTELGLELPRTWTALYQTIGELQKNNLQFGFPTGLPGYGLMLYQNGGQLYADDGAASELSGRTAVEAFKEWTRLYTNYGLPVEYDAANRFRSGEMPLLVADYILYNTLSVFAPEIKGQWGFTVVPGVESEDGAVDRSVVSTVTGSVLIRQSEHKQAAWTFMKWWASASTQAQYGNNLEAVLGASARYAAANTAALSQLPWTAAELRVLTAQREAVRGVPEVPGSYYTTRHLDNAFRRVVNYGEDERETIADYARIIDEEIRYKRRELKLS